MSKSVKISSRKYRKASKKDEPKKIQRKYYLKALEFVKKKRKVQRQIPYDIPQDYVNTCLYFCGWESIKTPSLSQDIIINSKRYAMRHNWPALASCVKYMFDFDRTIMPILWRSILMVLLNHPDSTPEHLSEFVQVVISLRTEEERGKFLTDIMTLPENIHKVVQDKRTRAFNEIEHFREEEDDDD